MPEQTAGEGTSEWTQESVEKQAAQVEQPQEQESQEEAPQTETQAEEPKRDKHDNLVSALTEERARRREQAAARQMLEQQLAQQAQFNQQLLARIAQSQQPAAPDPSVDPFGATIHTVKQTQAEVQQLRMEQAQRLQADAQARQYQDFVQNVKSQEAQFAAQQPDYMQAINYAKQARVKEYMAVGLSQQEALQRLAVDEHQLVQTAMQNGENPAKVAFDWAKARGYVPAKQKLEMQKDGQGAAMPTGSGSGRGGGDPSLEALLKMSPKDFAKATAGDNWEKLLRKFGG